MSLAHRSISAVRWTGTSNVVRAGLQVAQVVILTRLLPPADFGLMALVGVVIGYAALFNDMGLSTAFVQRQHITLEERSSLYWLSVAAGALLMVLLMAVSPLVANIFKEPRLAILLVLVSTNFLGSALGQQLRVDAEKALNFRPLAMIEISAAIGSFTLAVTTAWLGWGVFALVAASMFSTWFSMLLCWYVLSRGWRPLWRLRWSEVRWYVRFGGGMILNNIFNQINSTMDLLLGGRLLGVGELGVYSVPRNLILQAQFMVNPIFTRVGLPVIASIQHDLAQVRGVYLKIMNLTATVNAPIYLALAVFAPDFVLLLGGKFHDSAPLLQILAGWGLLRSFGNPVGSLLFGLGRVRLASWWNAALLLILPGMLWWGARHGAEGIAWMLVCAMVILFIPSWAVLVRPTCGVGLRSYAKQVLIPTLCAGGAGAVGWLAVSEVNSTVARLGGGLTVGLLCYVALTFLLNRACLDMVINTFKLNDGGYNTK